MKAEQKNTGTWWQRFIIRSCTLLFGVLLYWMLGFFMEDIASLPGPDYATIEQGFLSSQLVDSQKNLNAEIAEISRQIEHQAEKQKNIGDSSRNLQQTMEQLLELRKLEANKETNPSAEDQSNFSSTLNTFLENQSKYQELGSTLAELRDKKTLLLKELQDNTEKQELQRKPAREEFQKQLSSQRHKLAIYQLALLLPLLLAATFLFIKLKNSIYFPLAVAFGGATLLRVLNVVHTYFDSKYVKYIWLTALLLAVGGLLTRYIRSAAFPAVEALLKKYREGYEHFLCPNCEYPMRLGPRRFLFWTRRTVNKLIVPAQPNEQEESYTCPACQTHLFEECSACHKIRHALLPSCTHCGNVIPLPINKSTLS